MKGPPVLTNALTRGLASFRRRRSAGLLPKGRLSGPVPWVIAIMVSLIVIAAAAGLALGNLAAAAQADLAAGATVQIVEASPQERNRQAERAMAVLASDPRVLSVRRIPDDELEALLEPWLGGDANSDAIPMPALIDVRLRASIDGSGLDGIERALEQEAPAARVDAQADWLRPVFSAVSSLRWLAVSLIILLAFTASAAVWLAARSALGSNRGAIEIMHSLGGTDRQIAGIFQRSVGFGALWGGFVGFALGLFAVLVLARQMAGLGTGMAGGALLDRLDWALIGVIPLIIALVATVTARFTVLAALRRSL